MIGAMHMSYWKNKRVMVTGGQGFLGSHVVEKLKLAGCTQVCIAAHRDFDLSKADQVQRLFHEQRVDVLLHMAGLVGGIAANKARPADFFYQNLMMNTLTLHHAWQAGVNKVVAAGGVWLPRTRASAAPGDQLLGRFSSGGECSLLTGQTDVARPVDRLLGPAPPAGDCDCTRQHLWTVRQL